ncbi:flavin reductase family protein [Sciscionella marina]|uniref:flavin reductase family protein n=1 Tax=Sciscionella marina TaxID=508770 RepID=UPI00036F3B4C|nr:iron-sulfur cluster-binding domain-containing protein [Sciscionella marina]
MTVLLAEEARYTPEPVELRLRCTAIRPATHDVRTFVFEPDTALAFRPGQYLMLRLPVGERCYTIASPPTRPETLELTVKHHPGGAGSGYLHEELRVGQTLEASGPFGRFSYATQFSYTTRPESRYLFLSAGSGITPVMAMIRTLFDLGSTADAVFLHTARGPADRIFGAELDAIAASAPNFRVANSYGRAGLTAESLAALVPDITERAVFCCGPHGYRERITEILALLGADPGNYTEERFTVEQTGPSTVNYPVRLGAASFECGAEQTVLDAAQQAGVSVPFSCGQGMCGTCKHTLLSGSVHMRHNGGIRPKEIERNRILLCCAKPQEPLVIEG